MGGNVSDGWNQLKTNVGQGVDTMGKNLAQGNDTLKQNANQGLANFTANTIGGMNGQGALNPVSNLAKMAHENGWTQGLGAFGQGIDTMETNKNAAINNATSNLGNSWNSGGGGGSPAAITTTQQAAPGAYNGAGSTYGQSNAEQNFLNSYQKSLNPNTQYNINAQSTPYSNAPQAGAMKSATVAQGGK